MADYHMLQLQQLRAVVWLAQAAAMLLAYDYLHRSQFYLLMVLLLLEMLVLGLSQWRVMQVMRHPAAGIGEKELFAQLLVDTVLLTALLYVAGGATNPFVSYYLVPIALCAATLPRVYSISLALVCLLAYSALLFFYQPLQALSPHEHHHGNSGLSLHVLGMWLNFGLSALLITHFVVVMATTVRRQQVRINQLREQQLMDENIMAVATLAAGAAHEIGTPLSSLSVLLGDLRADCRDSDMVQDLQLMQDQVARCQQSLQQLASTAREHQKGGNRVMPVAMFVEQLLSHWVVLRPLEKTIAGTVVHKGPDVTCELPLTVEQALINLFNNAADASVARLVIVIRWDDHCLFVDIEDDGPGIPAAVLQHRGQLKESNNGMGVGLLLSHATLERAGGNIRLEPRPGGGTLTHILVPLHCSMGIASQAGQS